MARRLTLAFATLVLLAAAVTACPPTDTPRAGVLYRLKLLDLDNKCSHSSRLQPPRSCSKTSSVILGSSLSARWSLHAEAAGAPLAAGAPIPLGDAPVALREWRRSEKSCAPFLDAAGTKLVMSEAVDERWRIARVAGNDTRFLISAADGASFLGRDGFTCSAVGLHAKPALAQWALVPVCESEGKRCDPAAPMLECCIDEGLSCMQSEDSDDRGTHHCARQPCCLLADGKTCGVPENGPTNELGADCCPGLVPIPDGNGAHRCEKPPTCGAQADACETPGELSTCCIFRIYQQGLMCVNVTVDGDVTRLCAARPVLDSMAAELSADAGTAGRRLSETAASWTLTGSATVSDLGLGSSNPAVVPLQYTLAAVQGRFGDEASNFTQWGEEHSIATDVAIPAAVDHSWSSDLCAAGAARGERTGWALSVKVSNGAGEATGHSNVDPCPCLPDLHPCNDPEFCTSDQPEGKAWCCSNTAITSMLGPAFCGEKLPVGTFPPEFNPAFCASGCVTGQGSCGIPFEEAPPQEPGGATDVCPPKPTDCSAQAAECAAPGELSTCCADQGLACLTPADSATSVCATAPVLDAVVVELTTTAANPNGDSWFSIGTFVNASDEGLGATSNTVVPLLLKNSWMRGWYGVPADTFGTKSTGSVPLTEPLPAAHSSALGGKHCSEENNGVRSAWAVKATLSNAAGVDNEYSNVVACPCLKDRRMCRYADFCTSGLPEDKRWCCSNTAITSAEGTHYCGEKLPPGETPVSGSASDCWFAPCLTPAGACGVGAGEWTDAQGSTCCVGTAVAPSGDGRFLCQPIP